MNMKLLCVAVLVCLAVVFAEAKSVRSKKEKEETALKRVLAAVKEVKQQKKSSSESYSAENSEDPFLAYMNKVHDECGEEVLAFFKDDAKKVTLQEVHALLNHISGYSEIAAELVGENANSALNLGSLTEDISGHADLAYKFYNNMEFLHNASFCAFAPVFPVIFRMEVFGVEGAKSCDAMMWRYIKLGEEVDSIEETCEGWTPVAESLTESFKEDLQCISADVDSLHQSIQDAMSALASLDAVVQGDEELVTHTAIMADLAGLGNAMERIDGDAMMLSYGLYGLLHIAGELDNHGCFGKKEVLNQLDVEEKKMQEILDILKQMK